MKSELDRMNETPTGGAVVWLGAVIAAVISLSLVARCASNPTDAQADAAAREASRRAVVYVNGEPQLVPDCGVCHAH